MSKILATMADAQAGPLTDAAYEQLADRVLAAIETTVDDWLQRDIIDIDPMRTGGLLELAFPNGSRIVINTQPPLHELWLATRAGGYHYRYGDGRWLDTKDGSELFDVLSREASMQGGRALRFSAPE